MALVAGVRFKRASKVYDFDTNGLELRPGELVIVEVEKGLGLGTVAYSPKEADPTASGRQLKKVVRKADSVDAERNASNMERENEALRACRQKIAEYNLPMKLVRVEYLFDSSKAIFYFTSETRVDFRELVKYLASILHTRIEMKQIGVRDEAKMIGGIGSCGRELCCSGFLFDLEPVTIKMAKDQNLALNPAKISGICGRLMCCLSYEHGMYKAEKAERAAAAKLAGATVVVGGCGCAGGGCGHGHHAQAGDTLKAEGAVTEGQPDQKRNEPRQQRGNDRGRGGDRGPRNNDRNASADKNDQKGADKNNNNRNNDRNRDRKDAKDNRGPRPNNSRDNNQAQPRPADNRNNRDRGRGQQRPQLNARNGGASPIVKVDPSPLATQDQSNKPGAIIPSNPIVTANNNRVSAQGVQSKPESTEAAKAPEQTSTPDKPDSPESNGKGE